MIKEDEMVEDIDKIENFEAKETAHKLPAGWVILFIALILWGIYYYAAYTPSISGWSQVGELEQSMKE